MGTACLHFAGHAFVLHLLLEDLESLIDIVISNENLQNLSLLGGVGAAPIEYFVVRMVDGLSQGAFRPFAQAVLPLACAPLTSRTSMSQARVRRSNPFKAFDSLRELPVSVF